MERSGFPETKAKCGFREIRSAPFPKQIETGKLFHEHSLIVGVILYGYPKKLMVLNAPSWFPVVSATCTKLFHPAIFPKLAQACPT